MPLYHPEHRELQDAFDTRRLADRLDELLVSDRLTASDRSFIGGLDHFFLATVSPDGMPTVGYKGGDRGFVRLIDDQTLAFPNYNGNGMYLSMGNISANGMVGMLFLDWTKGQRLRVHGEASIDHADDLLGEYPEAQFVVRVHTTSVFPNCPRYVHRMAPEEQSPFVPRKGRQTPVPSWKRSDWAIDALPAGDPALDPENPVV